MGKELSWLELSMAVCVDEEHLGGEPQNGCQLLKSPTQGQKK